MIVIIAPLAVLAIRRPISRIEDTTKRLQYWKTYFEVKNLVGPDVTEDERLRCAVELREADDAAQNLKSKLLSFVAGISTIAIAFPIMTLISRASIQTIDMARQQFQGSEAQFRDYSEQLGFISLALQIVIAIVCWIWLRWWIRDYVWNSSATEGIFRFVRTSGRVKSAIIMTALTSMLLLWVFVCLSMDLPATHLRH